jgi:hypothetical protein
VWAEGGGSPLVGFLDDQARPGQRALGLPVVRPGDAIELLGIDAVLLSSDAHEARLWERAAGLRESGVEVIPVYGRFEERGVSVVASSVSEHKPQGVVHADRAS